MFSKLRLNNGSEIGTDNAEVFSQMPALERPGASYAITALCKVDTAAEIE